MATQTPRPISVLAWRELQFLRLGIEEEKAHELAEKRVDVVEFANLLARGCPVDLAERITEPC